MPAASEDADVVTSSDAYARRFEGDVGRYFLERQTDAVLELVRPWPGASVLDVGGGHGQLTGPLVEAGYAVSVLASDPGCEARVQQWTRRGRARFVAADLLDPGLAERSFDLVVSLRLLPHVRQVDTLLATLARLARTAVVVDYPTGRSVNALAGPLFGLKQGVEGDTRPFRLLRSRARSRVRGKRLPRDGPPAAVLAPDGALPRARLGRRRARLRGHGGRARPDAGARVPRGAEARAPWLSQGHRGSGRSRSTGARS